MRRPFGQNGSSRPLTTLVPSLSLSPSLSAQTPQTHLDDRIPPEPRHGQHNLGVCMQQWRESAVYKHLAEGFRVETTKDERVCRVLNGY
jgi:hypothetical protein